MLNRNDWFHHFFPLMLEKWNASEVENWRNKWKTRLLDRPLLGWIKLQLLGIIKLQLLITNSRLLKFKTWGEYSFTMDNQTPITNY